MLCWSDSIDEHEQLFDEIMESLLEHRLCVQIDKLEMFKDGIKIFKGYVTLDT